MFLFHSSGRKALQAEMGIAEAPTLTIHFMGSLGAGAVFTAFVPDSPCFLLVENDKCRDTKPAAIHRSGGAAALALLQ